MAAAGCVTSARALKHVPDHYVDIRPFLKDEQRLSPAVLTLSVPSLLRSKALPMQSIAVVGGDALWRDKQQLCSDLRAAGYKRVVVIEESARELKWQDGRLVHREGTLHGWREVDAQTAHRFLGDARYLPVILGRPASLPEGLETLTVVTDADALLTFMRAHGDRDLLVMPVVHQDPDNLPAEMRRGEHLWLADDLATLTRYQSDLALSWLQRNRQHRICGR